MAATRRGKIGKAVPPKTSAAEAFAVELRAVSGFRLCGTNEQVDEITVRRYPKSSECDVVVSVRGQQMVLRRRDYNQAVQSARIECKSYKIDKPISVESTAASPGMLLERDP
jgi:hypothetical protein